MPLELGWPRWQGSFSCRKQAAKDERLCSSSRLQEQGVEASREDHSVLDGKPAERRRHSITDPLEDLSQLVEEGQGARRRCRERSVSACPTPPAPHVATPPLKTLPPAPSPPPLPTGENFPFSRI